jgi:hypothetical protein
VFLEFSSNPKRPSFLPDLQTLHDKKVSLKEKMKNYAETVADKYDIRIQPVKKKIKIFFFLICKKGQCYFTVV